MKKEIWRKIPNTINFEVSNFGKIRNTNYRNTGITKEVKQSYDKDKYKKANIKGKSVRVHRIVAQAFLKDYNEILQVNHKDGNKENNYVDNLEMATSKENSQHRTFILKVGKIKPVVMISKNTLEKVKEFNSIREAERIMKIDHSTISKVCRGKKKSAGGYFWEYKEV